MEGVD
jgi:hypothetical protein